MKIFKPVLHTGSKVTRLEARIAFDQIQPHLPESLWYEVPNEYAHFYYASLDGFAVALVSLAMQLGEAIELDGPISPQLGYHLPRFQSVNRHWHPRMFQEVAIRPTHYQIAPFSRPQHVGLAFSGGVDSSYALWRQSQSVEPVPEYRVSHAVFAQFDLPHHPGGNYERACELFRSVLTPLDIKLLTVRTNQRFFKPESGAVSYTRWANLTHRAGSVGLGLVLSQGLGRFFLSSGRPFSEVSEDRLNLISDQWLSTEWFELVNHGIRVSRAGKIEALAHWPSARNLVDVCWWNTNGVENCGRCPKCVRTMTTMAAVGRLDHFMNFPDLRVKDQFKWLWRNGEIHYTKESHQLAQVYGRRQLARRLALILAFGRPWIRLRKLARRIRKPAD